jgi:hypothetical protein
MDAVMVMGLGDSWIPQGEFHAEDLVFMDIRGSFTIMQKAIKIVEIYQCFAASEL